MGQKAADAKIGKFAYDEYRRKEKFMVIINPDSRMFSLQENKWT